MDYEEFLSNKKFVLESSGFDIDKSMLNPMLYDFQKDIVRWALKKGKACIFADCGLGKTPMQLSWAYQVHKHTGGKILILAPLAVADQTKREAEKFGYIAKVVEKQADCIEGINITNYEKLDRFIVKEFIGIVLDESSILKSYSGKVRTSIIQNFHEVPYKLACTATPAPNDYMELGNHSEFCGVMTRSEMLAMFFVHDGGETSKWRLKGHAEDVFWQWLATFSVFVDNPKNIGYEVDGYDLPKLNINEIVVDGNAPTSDTLTLTERRQARKDSLQLRCEKAAELVNNSDEQWLVWCDLNDESHKLHELINWSVEVQGSDKDTHKSAAMLKFSKNEVKCLVTKPKIAGFGMNWQNCHNMIFTGLSDSYEQYYQALRRCWRFGQKEQVNVYIIISAKEGCVRENIERKQTDFLKMQTEMTELTKEITKKELKNTCRISTPYEPNMEMHFGIANTLSTVHKDNQLAVKIAEATNQGYSESRVGIDTVNLSVPGSKTRRGRVGKEVANTLDTSCNQGIFVQVSEELTVYAVWYEKYQCYIAIRKLTPKECFRLQGWTDDYFEKEAFVNSDSQLYKEAGNGVTVSVIEAMAKKMRME